MKVRDIKRMENTNKNNIYWQEDKDILRIILVVLVVIGHGTYYNITTNLEALITEL